MYRVQLVALRLGRNNMATVVDTVDCGYYLTKEKANHIGAQKALKFNCDDYYLCRRHADIVKYCVSRN